MVSAGNTGATMASALFRMGRIRGVGRPAIATPIPVPGSTPTVLLDAGANAECSAAWLVQFAQMGSAFATQRFGIVNPRVGLLSRDRCGGQLRAGDRHPGGALPGGTYQHPSLGPQVDQLPALPDEVIYRIAAILKQHIDEQQQRRSIEVTRRSRSP